MTRTLIIMRHGEALQSQSDDFNRPLTAQGILQASEIGARLSTFQKQPDLTLCSAALRTRQTLDAAFNAAEWDAQPAHIEKSIYTMNDAALMIRIAETSEDAASLMIIGHNPTISDIARTFKPEATGFSPATAAILTWKGEKSWIEIGSGAKADSIDFLIPA